MIRGVIKAVRRLVRFLFNLLFTIILIAGCLYVDARYIEPKLLKEEQMTLKTNKVKLAQPLKILQFSDTHLGEYYTMDQFKKLIDKINSLEPDLIVFTGDLIDDNKTFEQEEETSQMMKQLKSKYGKFAVYGNHDHGSNGTKRYARIMSGSGFRLLIDEHQEVTLDNGSQLSIIGIDDVVLSRPDMAKAFKGVPEGCYKLFLSHAPDVADEAVRYKADLQLSGHTHGGQVRLPILGAPFTPPHGKKYVQGLYDIGSSGMKLYVNSGIGTSQLPYRFMDMPEITVITLENE